MREHVDYDDRQHTVYSAARALPEDAARTWSEAFRRWGGTPRAVLDLGSGTGRFAPLLAATFAAPVYGVEPSGRMREVAEREAAHPGVRYLAGRAESVPLPGAAVDLVLMFLSFHHVVDRPAAVAEIRRVLRPGGRVLLRSTFSDRMPQLLWHRYFPEARVVERQMFPTQAEVLEAFEGFGVIGLERVTELVAPSLAVYAERLRLRGISTFEHLTPEATERGFAALDAAVAAEDVPRPVTMDSDLLVLG